MSALYFSTQSADTRENSQLEAHRSFMRSECDSDAWKCVYKSSYIVDKVYLNWYKHTARVPLDIVMSQASVEKVIRTIGKENKLEKPIIQNSEDEKNKTKKWASECVGEREKQCKQTHIDIGEGNRKQINRNCVHLSNRKILWLSSSSLFGMYMDFFYVEPHLKLAKQHGNYFMWPLLLLLMLLFVLVNRQSSHLILLRLHSGYSSIKTLPSLICSAPARCPHASMRARLSIYTSHSM